MLHATCGVPWVLQQNAVLKRVHGGTLAKGGNLHPVLRKPYLIQPWSAPALTLVDAKAGKASEMTQLCLWYSKRKTAQELWAHCWLSKTALQTGYLELCLKLNYCSLGDAKTLLPWLSCLEGDSPASWSTLKLQPLCCFLSLQVPNVTLTPPSPLILLSWQQWAMGQRQGETSWMLSTILDLGERVRGGGGLSWSPGLQQCLNQAPYR